MRACTSKARRANRTYAMQMHVDVCWFIIPWSSLMWPKDCSNMCHIFYYNFFVNFLQGTWIRPQKVFQTKILEVTSPSSKHYNVNSAKCFVTIAFHNLSFAGVLYHAIVREHLAVWLSNITLSFEMIMFTGRWLTSDVTSWILVWEICCGRIQVLWRKLTDKLW